MATLKESEERFVELYLDHEKPPRDPESQQEMQELLELAKNALARLELSDPSLLKDRSFRVRGAHVTAVAMISAGLLILLECVAGVAQEAQR